MSVADVQLRSSQGGAGSTPMKKIFLAKPRIHHPRMTNNKPSPTTAHHCRPCHCGYADTIWRLGILDVGFHSSLNCHGRGSSQECSHALLIFVEASPSLLISEPSWFDGKFRVAVAILLSIKSLRFSLQSFTSARFSPWSFTNCSTVQFQSQLTLKPPRSYRSRYSAHRFSIRFPSFGSLMFS